MDFITSSPGVHPGNIKCDWLDLTFPPDCGLFQDASGFLSSLGATARRVSDNVTEYRLLAASWGNFQLSTSKHGWSRLSASGGSLEALRGLSAFDDYLSTISPYPHNVTRLDACLDLRVPAPPVIQALVSRYPPDSFVYLTRKGVPPGYNLQPAAGGGLTGSFFAGRRDQCKSIVSGNVYDKRAERIRRTGEDPGPWLRFEMTCRTGTDVSLRDVHDPVALFWHFASPALLDAPSGAPVWVPFAGERWSLGTRPPVDFRRKLQRIVEFSVDLENMLAIADMLPGDGRSELMRLLRNRLTFRAIPAVPSADSPAVAPSLPPKPKSNKMTWQQGTGFIFPN